jgi:hypothetical protein
VSAVAALCYFAQLMREKPEPGGYLRSDVGRPPVNYKNPFQIPVEF